MNKVEIEEHSGFCGGVIRAISSAESFLSNGGRLYSLGAIVHNESELDRLSKLGLVPLDMQDLDEIPSGAGETILIRAHGQPPKVYRKLSELGFEVIDCTCPVVLSIQKDIRRTCENFGSSASQLVLFGNIGHPEVLGLVGQCEDFPAVMVIIVESFAQAQEKLELGIISKDQPTALFSQTTKSPVEYERIIELFSSEISGLDVHRTICKQVQGRHEEFEKFAREHDVILFVSGKTSSNGKVLSSLCKSVNFRTYHIGGVEDIQPVWFNADDNVGVCGATSTPRWLLEKVADAVREI